MRGQRLIAAGRQRLLDQRDAGLRAGGEIGGEVVVRSSPHWRRRSASPWAPRRARRRCARRIAIAAELDLEQRAVRRFCGGLGHGGGVPSEIVKAVMSGCGAGRPASSCDRPAGALGFQVPERAIERVAGGAGRHGVLQAVAVEPGGEPRPRIASIAATTLSTLSP